jgi:acetyltransferase-like isoleucine patch superfamily enzyme
MISIFCQFFFLFLPWSIRAWLLSHICGFQFDKGAKIGWSIVRAKRIYLGKQAYIGHGNLISKLQVLEVHSFGRIGNFNWISGGVSNSIYQINPGSAGVLKLGEHAALTSWHRLDCTGGIHIGKFSTVAGWQSQFVTHGIDLAKNQQSGSPIIIGDFTMVGTRCIILKGASLPNYSVLAAGSLLNKNWQETYTLYGGIPASPLKKISKELGYFQRKIGCVS